MPWLRDDYTVVLATDILIAALFAASLQFLLGVGGMTSFGHAAYFGVGAYCAAVAVKAGWPMPAAFALAPVGAGFAAVVFGWFCVRLSGVYLAMLTLAFAQIIWSIVFQWDSVTGGSNGLVGIWPSEWLTDRTRYYFFTLVVVLAGYAALVRIGRSPFGFALRGVRDSALRAAALGIDVQRTQWQAFALAGAFAGVAGGLFAFSKGSISPGVARDPALRRCAGDRAAGRHQRALRTAAGRGRIHVALRPARAHDRLLARAAGRPDPADRAGVPRRDRRRRGAPAAATGVAG